MSAPGSQPRLFRHSHQAMRAEWNLLLVSDDERQAAGAAADVFLDIDRIENELSRFKGNSDLGRLRTLRAGQSMSLGLATWDCLSLAKDVSAATGGAYDCAIGPLYELWRQRPAAEPPTAEEIDAIRQYCGSRLFDLDPDGLRITPHIDNLRLDLGALGKGYALDMAADQLRTTWDIHDALLITGGGSTVLALGHAPNGSPWLVNVGPDDAPSRPLPDGRAVSASGFAAQGVHIIDPRSGLPVSTARRRAWALAPSAALSDALSTAFLVMSQEEIAAFCATQPDVEAVTLP